jgi:hypothetical protein
VEFVGHYLKRVAGEVMGIIQRALNTVREYSRKKAELEKAKVTFEVEIQAKEKQYAVRMEVSEKLHAEKIRGLRTAYEKLKSKIMGIKTPQDLAILQRELSHEQPRLGR